MREILHNKKGLFISGILAILSMIIMLCKSPTILPAFSIKYTILLGSYFFYILSTCIALWHVISSSRHTRWFDKITVLSMLISPSVLVVLIGIDIAHIPVSQIYMILSGFFVVFFGTLLIIRYHLKNPPLLTPTTSHDHKAHNYTSLLLVFGALCIYLYFGLHHLGKEIYVDEKLWIYSRIETYWENIASHDWVNTRPSDKPGITTTIVTGPGLFFYDPSDYDRGSKNKDDLEHMFYALRLPQLLFIGMLLIVAFFLAQKLYARTTATFFLILISCSPLLLGISRIINPDALLWIFFIICFISYILYLQKNYLSYLYITGIFLGLALLTKYVSNIFILFFFLITFIDPLLHHTSPKNIAFILLRRLKHFGIMLFIALSIFFVLYPGAWVRHDRLLIATIYSEAFISTWKYFFALLCFMIGMLYIKKGIFYEKIYIFLFSHIRTILRISITLMCSIIAIVLYNTYTNMSLFDFSHIIESPKSIYRDVSSIAIFITSFYPLIFGVTPIVLILFIYAMLLALKNKTYTTSTKTVFYGILFIFLYYLGSVINNVVPIIRYQIVLYPLVILIASIGLGHLFNKSLFKKWFIPFACVLCAISILQLSQLTGYYFSYSSPLLPNKFIINSKDMGDGNYEIAQYLNALPHPEKILVWTDKAGVCQFFKGTCISITKDQSIIDLAPTIDYYIVSQNRQNYFTRLTQQKLSHDPLYKIRFDKLYDPHATIVYEIIPNNHPGQFMRIIDGTKVNIIQ